MFSRSIHTLALAASLIVAPVAMAQYSSELEGAVNASREELETDIKGLEALVLSPAAAEPELSQARARLAAIRTRLSEGDFHIGDRIAVVVQGAEFERAEGETTAPRSLERQLTDTFTVHGAYELSLPVVGVLSLRGVLRSELEPMLTREVARFIREPSLSAQALLRVSVQGAVAQPGFYTLPADAALSDALMVAGGPAPGAKLKKLRIERAGKPLWSGDMLQRAVADGRTLVEMNLQAGDQFVLPEGRGGFENTLRIIGLALTIPVAIYTLNR